MRWTDVTRLTGFGGPGRDERLASLSDSVLGRSTDAVVSLEPVAREVLFEDFYRRESGRLVALGYTLTGRADEAEALAQLAMAAVRRRWRGLADEEERLEVARRSCLWWSGSPWRLRAATFLWSSPQGGGLGPITLSADADAFWASVRERPRTKAQADAVTLLFDTAATGATTATPDAAATDRSGPEFAEELLRECEPRGGDTGLERLHRGRRRAAVGVIAAVIALLLFAVVPLPRDDRSVGTVRDGAPPTTAEAEPVAAFGFAATPADGWVSATDPGSDCCPSGFDFRPAVDSLSGPYIQSYVVESVWDSRGTRLTELAPGGFADWLRSNPAFIVESDTPVTVADQPTDTVRFRANLADAGDSVAMLKGSIQSYEASGIRFWPAERTGLATAVVAQGRTVVIEAMLPVDDRTSPISVEGIMTAYREILASMRTVPDDWEGGRPEEAVPTFPGTFPAVGAWTAPEGGPPEWWLTDLGSAGPEGREAFQQIRVMSVFGVADNSGTCCVLPAGGLGRWLANDSGLTVLATTPLDRPEKTAVYEVVAPGKDPGQVTSASVAPIPLWQVGLRSATAATGQRPAPTDAYGYEVDRGARLLVTPLLVDDQWYAVVAELPYLPVEQTPIRPVEQLRADYLALVSGMRS